MTTEGNASDSACSNDDTCGYGGGSSIASRLKLKKLTTVKSKQAVQLPGNTSSPSEYFTSSSHSDGGRFFNKRKRAAKNVFRSCNTERSYSHRNDGPQVVAGSISTRTRRNKRQGAEATQGSAKRNACREKVESEVRLATAIDASASDHLQPACPALQRYNETCSFAPGASNDDNNSGSSSDVEWEDVEGRSPAYCRPNICISFLFFFA